MRENKVRAIKEMYPAGTKIRLDNMADPFSPVPSGTEGVVTTVDDMGTIHMNWSNGRTLGLIYGEDSFSKIPEMVEAKEEKPKTIRFINSDYKTLFTIPDGGSITITYPDGEQLTRPCKFLDECHTQVGNSVFHICEFAEKMEARGGIYEPYGQQTDIPQNPQDSELAEDMER